MVSEFQPPLSLEEFREHVVVLLGEEANTFRSRYIDTFVDTANPYFEQYIAQTRDSLYFGYFWDVLLNKDLIREDEFPDLIPEDDLVHVMWDLHGPEKIFIPDYWKFPVDAVLGLEREALLRGLEHLPEDIYIFDKSFR